MKDLNDSNDKEYESPKSLVFPSGIGYIYFRGKYELQGKESIGMSGYWECLAKGLCGQFHFVASSPNLDALKEEAKEKGIKKFVYKKIKG